LTLLTGLTALWDEALTDGVAQGKNYAGKLAIRFACAANGQGNHEIDMSPGQSGQQGQSGPPERELPRYPSPGEPWAMTFAGRERLAGPVSDAVSRVGGAGEGIRIGRNERS
jgi:hypothetical protein